MSEFLFTVPVIFGVAVLVWLTVLTVFLIAEIRVTTRLLQKSEARWATLSQRLDVVEFRLEKSTADLVNLWYETLVGDQSDPLFKPSQAQRRLMIVVLSMIVVRHEFSNDDVGLSYEQAEEVGRLLQEIDRQQGIEYEEEVQRSGEAPLPGDFW